MDNHELIKRAETGTVIGDGSKQIAALVEELKRLRLDVAVLQIILSHETPP